MKISLSKEDLKRPHTDRSNYEIEYCNSCGTSFLRQNGVSHTGITGHKSFYSLEKEPTEKEFTIWCCSDRCLDWFHKREPSYKARKRYEKRLFDQPIGINRPMHETDELKLLADKLSISRKRIKSTKAGYGVPIILGRKGTIYTEDGRWIVLIKNVSKRLGSSITKKLSFMVPHSYVPVPRDLLEKTGKNTYNLEFSLDRMPSETEAEMVRKVVGLNISIKTEVPSPQHVDIDRVLAA
jgi:hypothetical protein